jgi:MFS family permease
MAALRDPRFRRLLAGNAVSSFGNSAMHLSLGIWAKDLTGSNAAAGEVFLALGLAYLTAPIGGALTDRFNRRPVLIVANTVSGLAVLGLLFVHSRDQLWIIYAVAAAYGAGSIVISSATTGLVKDLLPDSDLAAANAATQTLSQGLRIVSPLVGAALYAWRGGASLALFDATTFVVAIAAVLSIRVNDDAVDTGRASAMTGILEGFRHLRRIPLLAQVNLGSAIAMLVLGFYESVTFAVISALHRPASFFGILMSIQAAGSIAGGLATTQLIRRLGEARTLGAALVLWAAATTIYTLPALPAAVVALTAFGIAVPLFAVALNTANQRCTPSNLQGRVSAASDMLITLTQTISIAIGASLVDTIGYEPLLIAGVAVLTVPAFVLLTRPASGTSGPDIENEAERDMRRGRRRRDKHVDSGSESDCTTTAQRPPACL